MKRREFLTAAAAIALAPAVKAHTLPSRPIRIIVGFSPGGGADAVSRIISQKLESIWKNASVMVENKPGAAGAIATDYVIRQPADGSALLLMNTNHAIAPHLYSDLGYKDAADFSPIMLVGNSPNLLIGNLDQKSNTLEELIKECRETPGSVSFGSAGVGSVQHLATEMFALQTNVDVLHVPYKGSGTMVSDLLGGQINYSFDTMTSATNLAKSGKVKILAQTGPKRSPNYPNVPTVAELGYPDFNVHTWYAIGGPANMEADLVQYMNEGFNQAISDPDVAEKLRDFGVEDGGGSPADLTAFISAELKKWGHVIREADIKPE